MNEDVRFYKRARLGSTSCHNNFTVIELRVLATFLHENFLMGFNFFFMSSSFSWLQVIFGHHSQSFAKPTSLTLLILLGGFEWMILDLSGWYSYLSRLYSVMVDTFVHISTMYPRCKREIWKNSSIHNIPYLKRTFSFHCNSNTNTRGDQNYPGLLP